MSRAGETIAGKYRVIAPIGVGGVGVSLAVATGLLGGGAPAERRVCGDGEARQAVLR